MHPRGHELVHIRSMNWVQSTFLPCHAFLFFARTSFDILDHLTVSSTTLHALYFQLSYCEAASEDFCFAVPLMPKNATGGMLLPDLAELTNWSCNRSGLAVESVEPVLTLALDENMQNTS